MLSLLAKRGSQFWASAFTPRDGLRMAALVRAIPHRNRSQPMLHRPDTLHLFLQFQLGDFAGGGSRQGFHDADFARDFVVGEPLAAEAQVFARLVFRSRARVS